MEKTSGYGQFCPVAMAAELVCTRWTPLGTAYVNFMPDDETARVEDVYGGLSPAGRDQAALRSDQHVRDESEYSAGHPLRRSGCSPTQSVSARWHDDGAIVPAIGAAG